MGERVHQSLPSNSVADYNSHRSGIMPSKYLPYILFGHDALHLRTRVNILDNSKNLARTFVDPDLGIRSMTQFLPRH